MLGKLLKYDLKWIYKTIVIYYILAIFFSCVGRVLNLVQNSVLFSILTIISFNIAIAMMIGSLINCILRSWIRFVHNIYKDEAYLTHTLPIPKKTIYASKILSSIIATTISIIVIVGCIFICYYSEANLEVIKSTLSIAASTYNTTVVNLLLLVSLVFLLEVLFVIFIGFVGIILGHKYNKNKISRSIIISFALYIATQVLTLALIFIIGLFNPAIMNLINTTESLDANIIKDLMYISILIYAVYILFYYWLGKHQFEKGVNLE